jgi:hypothetical protein
VKVYISGVISNGGSLTPMQVEANKVAFYDAERKLIQRGHTPVNPLRLTQADATWKACMKVDLVALMDCDAILMLPDWHLSKGSRLEFHLAEQLGLVLMQHK